MNLTIADDTADLKWPSEADIRVDNNDDIAVRCSRQRELGNLLHQPTAYWLGAEADPEATPEPPEA
jgi:hypothetical protein